MNKIKVTALLLGALVFSSQGLASYGSANFGDYQDSWTITFGAAYSSRLFEHRETSADINYVPINEEVRTIEVPLHLSLMKEFMHQSRLSFTVKLFGGFVDGDYEAQYNAADPGSKNLSQFETKLSGVQYGGGISVNYNFFLYGYKLQPYAGADLMLDSGTMTLTHNGTTSTTEYAYSDMVVQMGAGVRAFDSEVSLMSYFFFSTPLVMSESLEDTVTISGAQSTPLATQALVKRAPLQVSVGFGYFF